MNASSDSGRSAISSRREAAALAQQGYAALNAGRPEEAVGLFRQALDLAPHDAEIHTLLGVANGRAGRADDAMECFRRAIRENPNFVDAHANLAGALQRQGDFDAAVRSYAEAYALNPDLLRFIAINLAAGGKGMFWLNLSDLATHLESVRDHPAT